jgi:hypothetical protein
MAESLYRGERLEYVVTGSVVTRKGDGARDRSLRSSGPKIQMMSADAPTKLDIRHANMMTARVGCCIAVKPILMAPKIAATGSTKKMAFRTDLTVIFAYSSEVVALTAPTPNFALQHLFGRYGAMHKRACIQTLILK